MGILNDIVQGAIGTALLLVSLAVLFVGLFMIFFPSTTIGGVILLIIGGGIFVASRKRMK